MFVCAAPSLNALTRLLIFSSAVSASLRASFPTAPAAAAVLMPRLRFLDVGPPLLPVSYRLGLRCCPVVPPRVSRRRAAASAQICRFLWSALLCRSFNLLSVPPAAAVLLLRRWLHHAAPLPLFWCRPPLLPSLTAAAAALLLRRCCPPCRPLPQLPCVTAAGPQCRPLLLLLRTGTSSYL